MSGNNRTEEPLSRKNNQPGRASTARNLQLAYLLALTLVAVAGFTIPMNAVVNASILTSAHSTHSSLAAAQSLGGSPLAGLKVTFDTEPISCGSITFNGINYTTGQSVVIAGGTYPIVGNSCLNFEFKTWGNGGSTGISPATPSLASTTVTVSSAGTLYAWFSSPQQFTVGLDLGPMNCGASVVLGGAVQGDSTSIGWVSPGTYNLSALPCSGGGWNFAGWGSAPAGGATFGSSSSITTTVTLSYGTTLTANFLDAKPYTLTLENGPIGCGSIIFSGTNYTYGQTAPVASGGSYQYHISENPCARFSTSNYWGGPEWGTGSTGSLYVTSTTPTILTETGNGTLSATYYSQSTTSLGFATGPTACGTIYVDGAPFTNGQNYPSGGSAITPGVYNLTAVPCTGFSFSSWNLGTSPGLSVKNNRSAQTLLTVSSGGGTLTANFTATAKYLVNFVASPQGCGQIEFNGKLYSTGQSTPVSAGTYDILAVPCANFQARNNWGGNVWGTGPGSGLSVAGPTSAGTTITVSGSGTLQTTFISDWTYSLSTFTGPTTCGTIYVDGNSFGNGGSYPGGISEGVYNITAVPCSGYTFSQWSYSGGLVVAAAGKATTTMNLTGSGNLGAMFIAGSPVTVTFYTIPTACGGIQFDGGSYTTGQTVSVAAGLSYPISAEPCGNYTLSGWSSTSGLTVASPTGSPTTVIVNAAGDLNVSYAYVSPTYTVTFDTGPTTCGSITVNATLPSAVTYTNGQSATFRPGVVYNATPNPCGNTFSYWTPGGGVKLGGSPGIAANSFTVSAPGYLVATFVSTTVYTVDFHLAPVGCGAINFNGAIYTDGQSVQLSPGTYNLGATSCRNYNFQSWESIGAIALGCPTCSTTTVTLSSFANLTALFSSYTSYTVQTTLEPTTCGSISLANISMGDAASVALSPGTYHIDDLPCANFAFHGWNTTGGVALLSGVTSLSNISVTGSGSLSVTNVGLTTYPITFATDPTTCGGVYLGSILYTTGQSFRLSPGVYDIGSSPCNNTGFGSWGTQGNISVTSNQLTVSASGTLTAKFTHYNLPTVSFSTSPTSCGSITLGGTTFTNGQSSTFALGNALLVASACPNFAFRGWSTAGGVSIINPSAASTSVNVSGSGTVYANFVGTTTYAVTLDSSPTGCGSILFNGVDYVSGQKVTVTSGGNYNILAVPCNNTNFHIWSTGNSGNLSVSNIYLSSTTLSVTGNGTLTVVFNSYSTYTVDFSTGPSTCGSITFGGQVYTSGQNSGSTTPPGNSTIQASPCPGYAFAFWSATGGVTVPTPLVDATSADVTGSGSLTANFSAVGTYPVTFTETGLPAYFSWWLNVGGNNVSTTSASNYLSLPNGTYTYTVGSVAQGTGSRYGPSPGSGTFTIAGIGFSQAVTYTSQVYLATSESPAGAGTVAPASGWYASGTPITLDATTAAGYVFAGWYGSGVGNYSGSSPTNAMNLYYPETEVALFSPLSVSEYPVTFSESGLPANTTWSATLNGVTSASNTSSITFLETNGTGLPWSVENPLLVSQGVRYNTTTPTGTISVYGGPTSQSVFYSPAYYLSVLAAPSADGTVSPGSGWYASAASVTLTATPAAGYFFQSWTGQGTGSGSGTANPLTLTMNGPINETAVFSSQSGGAAHYTLGFVTAPASCGSVKFAGTSYVSGSSNTSVVASVYTIDGVPCSGYSFASWSTTGSLTIGTATSASTTLTVSGNGTLTATFTATGSKTGFVVSFSTTPGGCGTISLGANTYGSGGSNSSVPSGTYTLSATPCPGYTFTSWSVAGGLSVASTTGQHTTLTVTGAGTLSATFTAQPGSGTKNTSTSGGPLANEWLTIGLLVVVLVLIAVVALLLLRGKKGGSAGTPARGAPAPVAPPPQSPAAAPPPPPAYQPAPAAVPPPPAVSAPMPPPPAPSPVTAPPAPPPVAETHQVPKSTDAPPPAFCPYCGTRLVAHIPTCPTCGRAPK